MSTLNSTSKRFGISMRKLAEATEKRDTMVIKRNIITLVRMYNSHPERLQRLVRSYLK